MTKSGYRSCMYCRQETNNLFQTYGNHVHPLMSCLGCDKETLEALRRYYVFLERFGEWDWHFEALEDIRVLWD